MNSANAEGRLDRAALQETRATSDGTKPDSRKVQQQDTGRKLTAAEIAEAVGGGRRVGDSYAVRCWVHRDKTPSARITQRGDRVLLHCFAGCEQSELIERLRARGLWQPQRRDPNRRQPVSWTVHIQSRGDEAVVHEMGGDFAKQYRLARLRGELEQAAKEIVASYEMGRERTDAASLGRELRLAIEVGGIDVAGVSLGVIDAAIERAIGETCR
jgi:hypothetical protein